MKRLSKEVSGFILNSIIIDKSFRKRCYSRDPNLFGREITTISQQKSGFKHHIESSKFHLSHKLATIEKVTKDRLQSSLGEFKSARSMVALIGRKIVRRKHGKYLGVTGRF